MYLAIAVVLILITCTTCASFDSLTNNSPKGLVLKEAYKFLQLEENASISEIDYSFFRLANQFKLGTDNFQKLQFYMQVIKIF